MSTDWIFLFAGLGLLALVLFLGYQWRHAKRSRTRQFNTTSDVSPLVIGSAKWHDLTARQQQVALLAARGLSNAEIAQHLGVKTATVDAHLKKIYATLDIHSRTELAYQIKEYID